MRACSYIKTLTVITKYRDRAKKTGALPWRALNNKQHMSQHLLKTQALNAESEKPSGLAKRNAYDTNVSRTCIRFIITKSDVTVVNVFHPSTKHCIRLMVKIPVTLHTWGLLIA